MDESFKKSLEEWRANLSPDAFAVCRMGATERPFTGKWDKHYAAGTYSCTCCGASLFKSGSKFDSGSGWPSFFQPFSATALAEKTDSSHGMRRVEVQCGQCSAHLGHVFSDGPRPTGMRYCINSVALQFTPLEAAGTSPGAA